LYKKTNNELQWNHLVYHLNDSVSHLFYKINNEVLIYKRLDTTQLFSTSVHVKLEISLQDNLQKIIDTVSFDLIDKQASVKVKDLNGSVFFKLKKGFDYFINMRVHDRNKKVSYTQSFYSSKTSAFNRENFLIKNLNHEVCYTNYFKPNELIYVSSHRNTEKFFNVDYYNKSFKLALPPFSFDQASRFSYQADSSFSVYANSDEIEITLPNRGFYHLQTNDTSKDGVTFYVYESSFPKIKDAEQMILATRFIMAKQEFENCMNSIDKKASIDKFWTSIGGSKERAIELLKKYYGRIQEANKLFSSYQEGWKTDRGMIYVVFGAPNSVTKLVNGEVWTYGELDNQKSTIFAFSKVVNPFTDNDFSLERSESLKLPWYQAVDAWRQGRIYLDN
jgi:GWxTD domain-containing protein